MTSSSMTATASTSSTDGTVGTRVAATVDATQATRKLTQAERRVLALIADGYSSQEAADLLFVSKRTVDFHLVNVYKKLGVTNRVQAIREATRRGELGGAANGAVAPATEDTTS